MTTATSETVPEFDARAFHEFEHAGWDDKAGGWQLHFERVSTQSVDALLRAVAIGPDAGSGQRLLDIATGPGYAAAEAQRRGAKAIGVDFAEAQIKLAREQFPQAVFEVADAEALPFEDASFDAVVINFGLQHCPDPERALDEAYRVLRPGGRVAFTVWAKPPHTVGFHIVQEAIARHGDLSAPIPEGPPYYRFSDAEASTWALRRAGFGAPRVTDVQQFWRLAEPARIVTAVAEGTVRAGALLRAQSGEARVKIEAAVIQAAEDFRKGGVIELPMPAVLAVATKIVVEARG